MAAATPWLTLCLLLAMLCSCCAQLVVSESSAVVICSTLQFTCQGNRCDFKQAKVDMCNATAAHVCA